MPVPQGPNEKVLQGPQLQGHFERGDLLFSSQGRKVKIMGEVKKQTEHLRSARFEEDVFFSPKNK